MANKKRTMRIHASLSSAKAPKPRNFEPNPMPLAAASQQIQLTTYLARICCVPINRLWTPNANVCLVNSPAARASLDNSYVPLPACRPPLATPPNILLFSLVISWYILIVYRECAARWLLASGAIDSHLHVVSGVSSCLAQ